MIERLLPSDPGLRAPILMVMAMASFVVNDSLVKATGQRVPVGELIAVRGVMSIAIISLIAARSGVLSETRQMTSRPVLIRAGFDLVATLAFITALLHMPIANLTAITQSVPLAVTFLSAVFLGEKVGLARIGAIVTGFIGVLLIVRPSPANFTFYDGLAFFIVFAVAIRDVMTKRIPARVPTLIVALVNAGFVTAGGLGLGLLQGFHPLTTQELAMIAAASVFLAGGYMLMVATLRLGALSATAPFRYSVLVFALIIGMVVFGEYPGLWAGLGMVLIVAAGLFAARQEFKLKSSDKTQSP